MRNLEVLWSPFLVYCLEIAGLEALYAFLGWKFLYSGASYPKVIPYVVISTIVISSTLMIIFLLSEWKDEKIRLSRVGIIVVMLTVMWGLIAYVLFLVISFFVMVSVGK